MKNNYSEIAFILDRSGSMDSCRDAAIEGFNRFLEEQQKMEGLAKLTLVLFDDQYLVPVNGLPVAEVVPLDSKTYVPRANTALLDAIGRAVGDLGARLASLPEPDRPGQVIVAILTDGLENASQKFSWDEIARIIREQTDKYRWTFLFLGANQDAIATAAQMNIAPVNAATFMADEVGMRASSRTLSRKVGAMKRMLEGTANAQEMLDAEAALSDMIAEEDSKERH